MDKMLIDSQIKGITCELNCSIKLLEYGFAVSVPLGNVNRYDLLIDGGNGRYCRIQCKNSHQIKNGSYVVSTSNMQFTSNTKKVKHYTQDQVDFICSVIEDQLVVIPINLISGSKLKVFRSHTFPPKNNSCFSTCNWIEDYTIEKQLLPFFKGEPQSS